MPLGPHGLLVPAASGGVTTYCSDSFNRANGGIGTADVGGAWVSTNHGGGAGTFEVFSNVARLQVNGGPSGENTCTLNSTIADATISFDFDAALKGAMAFRLTDGTNWNLFAMDPGSLYFYKIVAGTYTQVGSTVTGQPTTGSHSLKLILSGTTWTGYVDGVQQIQATSQTNQQSATKHGLRCATGDVQSMVWDNFLVTS